MLSVEALICACCVIVYVLCKNARNTYEDISQWLERGKSWSGSYSHPDRVWKDSLQISLKSWNCLKKRKKSSCPPHRENEKESWPFLVIRSELNISGELIFARPWNARFPFRGVDCLRTVANEAKLENSSLINSTSLQKQLASLAQLLNLNEGSQDLLATFQGHDIRIHREFLRIPSIFA